MGLLRVCACACVGSRCQEGFLLEHLAGLRWIFVASKGSLFYNFGNNSIITIHHIKYLKVFVI